MTPTVIIEAGLHGNGSLEYYRTLLDDVSSIWNGWPPLVLKTQHWVAGAMPAGTAPIMRPLSIDDLETLADYAHAVGMQFGVTPHDPQAMAEVLSLGPKLDILKLGSAGVLSTRLTNMALDADVPALVMSAGLVAPAQVIATATMAQAPAKCVLFTHSAYPAPLPDPADLAAFEALRVPGVALGYSCHTVPARTMQALDTATTALQPCAMLEVHVSNRVLAVGSGLLPKDMPASLRVSDLGAGVKWFSRKWHDTEGPARNLAIGQQRAAAFDA